MPEACRSREQVENHRTTCTQVLFQTTAELGFFHFLEIVTGWLVPYALVARSQYSLAGTFHRRRSPLLKTGFSRQAGKGAETTKEKSRECFTYADKGSFVQVPRFPKTPPFENERGWFLGFRVFCTSRKCAKKKNHNCKCCSYLV